MLPEKADFAVIGGGIIGCSIAFNLAKLGAENVIVLEKGEFREPSPQDKYYGAISQQFDSPINIFLSRESLKIYKKWQEYFPEPIKYDIGYRQIGSILVVNSPSEFWDCVLRTLRQQRMGSNDSHFIDRRSISEMIPYFDPKDIIVGLFCSSDAIVDISAVRAEYKRQAEMLGVKFFDGISILDIEANLNLMTSKKRSIEIIFTDKKLILTKCVINAAGPKAAEIGRMLDIEIPIALSLRRELITQPSRQVSKNNPVLLNFRDGKMFYCRPDNGDEKTGCQLLIGEHDAEKGLVPKKTHAFLFIDNISRRIIELGELKIARDGIIGLVDSTPDFLPILGKTEKIDGLILANGFSGHGLMHSPIIGKIISEIALFGETSLFDISRLGLDSFRNRTRPPAEKIII